MNTLFLASNAGAAGGGNMMMLVMLIIIGLFMYFGMIRPQKKQQQKRMEMMDSLKKGDRVVLVDGLHGKVDSINNKDKTVVIDADGIYLTFSRMAIRQIVPAEETTTPVEKTETKPTEKNEEKPTEAEKNETSEEKPADVKADENSEDKKD